MAIRKSAGLPAVVSAAAKARDLEAIIKALGADLKRALKYDLLMLAIPGIREPVVLCGRAGTNRLISFKPEPGFFAASGIRKAIETHRPSFCLLDGKQGELFGVAGCGKPNSMAVVPLVSMGRSVGALCIGRGNSKQFSKSDRALLEHYAVFLAAIVHIYELVGLRGEAGSLDLITGLRNHHYIQIRVGEEINRVDRYKGSFALLYISIDGFPRFNESYGFRAGTEALVKIARIVADHIRDVDIAGRFGGGSFIVLLTNGTLKSAKATADRIHKELGRTRFKAGKRKAKITVSIGISVYPTDSSLRSGLIEAAEMSADRAEQTGRGRTAAFATSFVGK
jgi:diguanylate cyclase (GGDEF)-like protein